MNRQSPWSDRPPTSEVDRRRAELAERHRDLAEQMKLATAMQVAASRILWTYATDDREPDGAER